MTDEATREWAIVELMGYRRRAGIVHEVERFGTKLMRIDIPVGAPTDGAFVSEFYTGSAIYAFRPSTEEIARTIAEENGDPRPIAPHLLSHRVDADPDENEREEYRDD